MWGLSSASSNQWMKGIIREQALYFRIYLQKSSVRRSYIDRRIKICTTFYKYVVTDENFHTSSKNTEHNKKMTQKNVNKNFRKDSITTTTN